MTTTDEVLERIEVFARQLSEELGDVDDSNSVRWLNSVEEQAIEIGDAVTALVASAHVVSVCHIAQNGSRCRVLRVSL